MKIIIKTVYENVTEEFLRNWLDEISTLVELQNVRDEIKETGHAVYVSKDPDSACFGTTEYSVVK